MLVEIAKCDYKIKFINEDYRYYGKSMNIIYYKMK